MTERKNKKRSREDIAEDDKNKISKPTKKQKFIEPLDYISINKKSIKTVEDLEILIIQFLNFKIYQDVVQVILLYIHNCNEKECDTPRHLHSICQQSVNITIHCPTSKQMCKKKNCDIFVYPDCIFNCCQICDKISFFCKQHRKKDEFIYCRLCGTRSCQKCFFYCKNCNEESCKNCFGHCDSCYTSMCMECMSSCNQCNEYCCSACRHFKNDDIYCDSCYYLEFDSSDEN